MDDLVPVLRQIDEGTDVDTARAIITLLEAIIADRDPRAVCRLAIGYLTPQANAAEVHAAEVEAELMPSGNPGRPRVRAGLVAAFRLTPRQGHVLELVDRGLTVEQIAAQWGIKPASASSALAIAREKVACAQR